MNIKKKLVNEFVCKYFINLAYSYMTYLRLTILYTICTILSASYSAEGLTMGDYNEIARNQGFTGSSTLIKAKELFAQGNRRNGKNYNFVVTKYPSFEIGTSADGLTLGEYMILARARGADGPYVRVRAKSLFLEANYRAKVPPYFRNVPLDFSLGTEREE